MAVASRPRMHCLEAQFELVTPAFCGGADNRAGPAEIRLPSILGQLRWWWRALAWSRTSGAGDEEKRLEKIYEWEGNLFGSAEFGTGAFTARLSLPKAPSIRSHRSYGYEAQLFARLVDARKNGISYCAGQGLRGRKAVAEGAPFYVTFRERPRQSARIPVLRTSDPTEHEPPSLTDALWAFGLLGGIGARNRRGFGSVTLRNWDKPVLPIPKTIDQYASSLKELYENFVERDGPFPPISAFSPFSRIVMCPIAGTDAAAIHGDMGQAFLQYRNCYRPSKTNRFKPDHDWFYRITGMSKTAPTGPTALFHQGSASVEANLRGAGLPTAPERAIFGLPHNYSRFRRFPSNLTSNEHEHHQYKADVNPNGRADRRASPLLLHVHCLSDGAAAVWCLFEATFLPDSSSMFSIKREYIFKKVQKRATGGYKDVPGSEREVPSHSSLDLPFTVNYAPAREFLTEARLGRAMRLIAP